MPATVVSCDGLDLPGPLGGLFDIASALGPSIEAAVAAHAPREQLFRTILDAMREAELPAVIVGEDAHWSDEATIDLIRFLGRRIASTRTLFIVTYRSDSIDSNHALRRVLGDLATESAVIRMTLPPLSVNAVRTLAAGTGIDPEALHKRTGGNPFYVTEVIGSGEARIPASVRDAVLGRASRLSTGARAVLDIAAVAGPGLEVDLDLVSDVAGSPVVGEVDECLANGVLQAFGDGVAFPHAITREALIEAISPPRRRETNLRVLRAMETNPRYAGDLARLAQHAADANDRDAVLRYAPAAARHAAQYGAHREAAAQFARALKYSEGLPANEMAVLLESRAYECYLTGEVDASIGEQARAVESWRAHGDPLKTGNALRLLSRFCWFGGRDSEADVYLREALAMLEALPPGPELAMAYSSLSQLRVLAHDAPETIVWGQRAIDLALMLDDKPTLVHAMTNVGTAMLFTADEGQELIEQAAEIARACNLQDDISRAYTNMAYQAVEHHRLDDAERIIAEGLAFTSQNDLVAMELYLHALQARLSLSRGHWRAAAAEATGVTSHPSVTPPSRIVALTVLGQAHVRSGQSSKDALDEAEVLASRTGALMRLGPLRVARAEAAWLEGDPELAAAEAEREFATAVNAGERWLAGALALWMQRGGRHFDDCSSFANPYAHEIGGRFAEAAAAWKALGMPLEEARALERSGSEASIRRALETFERLEAKPDAARAARALRSMGAKRIPRGPRPETRTNIANLTARELDVLALLVEGHSNPEIAASLYVSPRTVGHHVSAILAKLGISSRAEAKSRTEALGLL